MSVVRKSASMAKLQGGRICSKRRLKAMQANGGRLEKLLGSWDLMKFEGGVVVVLPLQGSRDNTVQCRLEVEGS